MKDVMRGKMFTSSDELQAVAVQISKLPERWQRCIDIGGEYL
jgi:hypothetical protein